jgi:hypothetical protein
MVDFEATCEFGLDELLNPSYVVSDDTLSSRLGGTGSGENYSGLFRKPIHGTYSIGVADITLFCLEDVRSGCRSPSKVKKV